MISYFPEDILPTGIPDTFPEEGYEVFAITVDKGQEPLRVDKFLMHRLEKVSRNRIQNAARAGTIRVNRLPVRPSYKVRPGDVLSVLVAAPPEYRELQPENIPLRIVHEDADLLVIDKPPGLVVHPGVGNYTGTLVNGLLYHLNSLPGSKTQPLRPGIVHRIDKNTSGLLLVAKNEYAMTFLARQFYEHTIERNYVALVWGDLEQERGTVAGFIGRSHRDRKLFSVYEDEHLGKAAVTHYKVLKRFRYVTMVECRLETGRTHQIRVHMKHLGHPVFNDEAYGGDKVLRGNRSAAYLRHIQDCFSLMPRQALHARTLGFIHPSDGKKMSFESSLPDDFRKVVERWENYFSGIKEQG